MRNHKYGINGWHIFASMFRVADAPIDKWVFSAVVAILVLGMGVISALPSAHVQAQDGNVVVVGYQWQIHSASRFSPICVGETKSVEISVFAMIQITPTAQSQTGRIRLRIRAASENPDILTANSAPAPSGPPTSTSVIITGKAPGRASVSVTAVDERFSPTPPVPDWNQSSFTVEVIRCHYSVNGFVTWVTTIEGAHVMFTAQLEQISLESEDGRVFHPAGYPRAPVAIKWGATVNRVRGCRADYQSFSPPVPAATIEGQIVDDEFVLTLSINSLLSGGVLFECNGYILHPGQRIRSCADYLDGLCDRRMPNPTLTPETRLIRFPIDGGTTSVPMILSYTQGSAQGTATVTLSRD